MKIALPLDDSQRSLVRPVSKAVFKSFYALEAFVVIAEDERFYPGQIAQDAGCEPSYAGELIKSLAAAHLIERLASEPGQIRKYYRRLPSPLWDFAVSMTQDLIGQQAADVTRLTDRR